MSLSNDIEDLVDDYIAAARRDWESDWEQDHDCRDTAPSLEIDIHALLDAAELAGLLPAEWSACDDAKRKWRGLIEKAVERAS